ncbi:DUF2793 domain-containing protein [Phyllobacterium pellucidum]|uniref:DUF2793 domain-containing protein n=1 Tax=Phyllobacterium pellucidum TaxID=2740464 RepID=UPI001D14D87A|nr:DUF2793 domain-containing protein [Phyllobacterium sp. T1018]UGY10996.1 DUF2793 domain-containing protein [Phyllobacterium sp. T1018]
MDQTSNLKLPYIAPSQAQKHVTHNEAIRALDALVQLSVLSSNAQAAPSNPAEGDRYIIGSGASGAWAGKDQQVAAFQDGAWAFFQPLEGWSAWVAKTANFLVFTNGAWKAAASGGTNPVNAVGIQTVADDTNRLAVKSPASLFDHAGTSHQIKINKSDDNQAASLLFQSNYQGRAEMSTIWGRDFRIKTSADGSSWRDVMIADNATGVVRFPNGIASAATGKRLSGLVFLPAGPDATIYQMPGSATPAAAKVASIAADIITLAANSAVSLFGTAMRDVAMVRLWNVTKSPAQSAWVKWDTALNGLQVVNADHIKQWASGDALQIVDPVKKTIAIDISPLMQKRLGGVFAQDGVLLTIVNSGNPVGSLVLPSSDPSPQSGANLVYFRGDETRVFNIAGVYG